MLKSARKLLPAPASVRDKSVTGDRASPTASKPPNDRISAVRRFNRLYTREIGALDREFLSSPFTLTEMRVLYELCYNAPSTATRLCQDLALDAGYMSRILKTFSRQGFLARELSPTDGRQSILHLSAKGRRGFAQLEDRQRDAVDGMLGKLSAGDQRRLLDAMRSIETLLTPGELPAVPYIIRPPEAGDIGWIIHRQGVLYNQEYGWDEQFEALVGEIASRFVQNFDAKHERCWIAEREGEIIGSVFCAKKSATVAQLRLLYVEPSARGLGVGTRLVDECVAFARRAGYRKMTLWTNGVLHSARHIYQRAGFVKVAEKSHHSFGHDLVSQTWQLAL